MRRAELHDRLNGLGSAVRDESQSEQGGNQRRSNDLCHVTSFSFKSPLLGVLSSATSARYGFARGWRCSLQHIRLRYQRFRFRNAIAQGHRLQGKLIGVKLTRRIRARIGSRTAGARDRPRLPEAHTSLAFIRVEQLKLAVDVVRGGTAAENMRVVVVRPE